MAKRFVLCKQLCLESRAKEMQSGRTFAHDCTGEDSVILPFHSLKFKPLSFASEPPLLLLILLLLLFFFHTVCLCRCLIQSWCSLKQAIKHLCPQLYEQTNFPYVSFCPLCTVLLVAEVLSQSSWVRVPGKVEVFSLFLSFFHWWSFCCSFRKTFRRKSLFICLEEKSVITVNLGPELRKVTANERGIYGE